MNAIPKHKVFVSYHHEDQWDKDNFVRMMGSDIVDRSVDDGDIDDQSLGTETIRQRIRDYFIQDATVTVVLIGPCTWQRKHVDWEIGSSLRDTKLNSRCGLLGILLPSHPNARSERGYNQYLLPPRLADNCGNHGDFAEIYDWSNDSIVVRRWIHEAFLRRTSIFPNNGRPQFGRNRTGQCSRGWQE